jgi:hypothetical protein
MDFTSTIAVVNVDPSVMIGESGKPIDYRKAIELKKWFRDNLVGKTVTIESDGRSQTFTNSGLKASLKKIRYPQHNEMYAEIAALIENAVYDRTIPADEKHQRRLNGQEVYYAAARIETEIYSVEIRLDIPKNTDGLHYKDHTVTQIKIAPAAGAISTEPLSHTRTEVGNMQSQSSIDRISLAVLRGKVKPV